MRRQALYRVTWEDGFPPAPRPPSVVRIVTPGPWRSAADGELLYEGPLGRTTVTVEAREPEPEKQP